MQRRDYFRRAICGGDTSLYFKHRSEYLRRAMIGRGTSF
jgi:hypothetical protein